MAQREWVEKDFYKELGVTSDASKDEIKRAARKILADNHPDRNPGNTEAEEKYKAASEAKEVLTDDAKRKEYDETRRLFAGGGFGRRGGGFPGGGGGFGGDGVEFNLGDLFDAAGQTGGTNIGDLFGGLFGRGAQPARVVRAAATTWRPRPNSTSSRPPRAWRCRCGSPVLRPAPTATAAVRGRAPARRSARTATVPAWSTATRGVRVLRALHGMPWQRVDHRAPLRRVPRHRSHHADADHQRPHPSRCRGRPADSVGGAG